MQIPKNKFHQFHLLSKKPNLFIKNIKPTKNIKNIKRINTKRLQTKQIEISQPDGKGPDPKTILKACEYSYFIQTFSLSQLISPKITSLFYEKVKCLDSLQIFNITLDQSKGIVDPSLDNLHKTLKATKELSQIKKFTISCQNYDIGGNGIKSLGKALKRLRLLQEMCLELEKCEDMNDLGLMRLSQGFRRCKVLKVLKFKIPR